MSEGKVQLPSSFKKILIVDDIFFNQQAMMIQLKLLIQADLDKICCKAFNGQEALDLVKADVRDQGFSSFNLIFMDCNMPVMDGYEATQCIRNFLHEEGLEQPIIIAVTGHSEGAYVERAFDSGMNLLLPKPVNTKQLKDLISRMGY